MKIPNKDAQNISSDLKKLLVENNLLDIQSSEFQKYVFELMKKYYYNDVYISRYIMMNQFFTKRVPLIILIAGPPFIGKSTIATKLSERMNISNVLQTKVISDVMSNIMNNDSKPFWVNGDITSDDELIKLFQNESMTIRKGANYDIQKAFTEGKALIIEGHHIIPELYIKKSSNYLQIYTPEPLTNETNREKIVREQMNELHQHGIIIPFLLTASEKDQLYLLKNGIFYGGENISYNVIIYNLRKMKRNQE
jgi:2-phosphoglycerate kinase